MKRRGIFRPRYVELGDRRPPMIRLLDDCNNSKSGMIEVAYEAQWRTLFKGQRLGYIDSNQRITTKGREFLRLYEERQS